MGNYLMKGLVIGLMFGLPAGVVGALTMQRTFNYGIRAGLTTGLGSSVADCLYACIGAFGLRLISDILFTYQIEINRIGSAFIIAIGIRLILNKSENLLNESPQSHFKMFLSSFVVGISNPAAILTFLFAFSYFEISGQLQIHQGFLLIVGVFLGTYLWWGMLSLGANGLRKKVEHYYQLNQVFGLILTLLGIIFLVKTLL